MVWQLFVHGLDSVGVGGSASTRSVLIPSRHPERTLVSELKALVREALGLVVGQLEFSLVHGGSILQEHRHLQDYPSLGHGCTLTPLVPLLGGASSPTRQQKKNPDVDPTLPRSDEECMITKESFAENGTLVLEMPCGHPISPDGLVDYCWSELKANKTKILCVLCTNEWSVDVIRKYGAPSPEEYRLIEERLGHNACLSDDTIKTCRKCKSFVSRINENNRNVICTICTSALGRTYSFCWYCLREWRNPGTVESCGYPDCKDEEKLEQLQNAGMVVVQQAPRMEMYALRACPHCGEVVRCADSDAGSWRVRCRSCGTEFCFVCLRAKAQGSWFCGNVKVNCSLAPVQRKIPHREEEGVEDDNNTSNSGSICAIL